MFYYGRVRKQDLQPVTYPVAARNPRGIMDSQPKIVMLPKQREIEKIVRN
jgi:hypothetical protein